ncbi:uncharacterized protein BDR25DRAFT_315844 [Lindgomyces ingoldianus]|uniref:Uncharacterized protein n=1 Tax=Lindgomyces ingoldianus TaxID=673940 RepID=A0ACB6QRW3_9PLEO|nr:uncharacterized protein BDR25DRAFT_315844 [Lindgomyces ingoldianus]KAF2468906.1 hypothetical protein BDR25DRAFT_315844 [Lindgomyces ingoldianus]
MTTKPGGITTVLYRRFPDHISNMDYYFPFTTSIWAPHGMTNSYVCEGAAESDFAYYTVVEWKGVEGWEAAMKDEKAKEIMEDVKNFTNEEPIFVVDKAVS